LAQVLRHLKPVHHPDVLVGTETKDDAAVYRLSAEQAIVETADFFTPVVDDPYWFGRIAAANAFSDIWAMGARPLFAINLVGWPVQKLSLDLLGEVVRGGADTAALSGAPVLGGHSIDDPEPKYGMAVTGIVHPDRILRNVGAQVGDRLLLTKPLGSGIVTTAVKRGIALGGLLDEVTRLMATLNRAAGEVLAASGSVHALTDVTGFGLLGHAWEMAEGSGVSMRFDASKVPVLDGVVELARADVVPGGSKATLAWLSPHLTVDQGAARPAIVLCDAQTNGGLLAAVPPGRVDEVVAALLGVGVVAAVVGEVGPGDPPRLEVV
jgi:selenide, water dikinase